jgi:hypothetical protein
LPRRGAGYDLQCRFFLERALDRQFDNIFDDLDRFAGAHRAAPHRPLQ